MQTDDPPTIAIRRAREGDLATIAKLGSLLALQHLEYDPLRFTLPHPLEESHAEFFTAEMENADSVILLLEVDNDIAGYAFLRREPASFVDLTESGVWLHDIYLEEAARGRGVGKRFFEAVIAEARKIGPKSLMLSVSPKNSTARQFFEKFGFRPTMIEMRLDLETSENS